MIIDTHSHIYLNKELTEQQIIKNSLQNWVEKIVSVWIDLESSQTCIDLSKKYKDVMFATVWIHPCEIQKYIDDPILAISKLELLILENITDIKAIWECWLDYFHLSKSKQKQKEEIALQKIFFEKQIDLAKKFSLPLVIHVREAFEDVFDILQKKEAKNFVLHCYTWDLNFAYKVIYNFPEAKISFSGIVTYPSAKILKTVAANISLDKILVETDAPYLAPQQVRWTENIPANTKETLEHIIDLRLENWKKETKDEIYETIYKSSIEFFNLK